MNKLLILLLAVCLISCAHAFVKRDAPASDQSAQDALKKIQESLGEFGKQIGDKAGEIFDPENLKKNFDELINTVNKGIESMKSGAPKQ